MAARRWRRSTACRSCSPVSWDQWLGVRPLMPSRCANKPSELVTALPSAGPSAPRLRGGRAKSDQPAKGPGPWATAPSITIGGTLRGNIATFAGHGDYDLRTDWDGEPFDPPRSRVSRSNSMAPSLMAARYPVMPSARARPAVPPLAWRLPRHSCPNRSVRQGAMHDTATQELPSARRTAGPLPAVAE
jgi:hypothetical protein